MIFNTKSEIEKYAVKIFSSSKKHTYVLDSQGTLQVDSTVTSHTFIIYINGKWFASIGKRHGSSEPIPENGEKLFTITNNQFLAVLEDGCVEYSSGHIDLSVDFHGFAFICQKEGLVLYLMDGAKKRCPMMTLVEATAVNIELMTVVITALIHQCDPKAAEKLVAFLSKKEEHPDLPKNIWE